MEQRPTIRDVARAADVSVATVSRILNGLPGFSCETQERVQKVIKELGYRRNGVARNLKMQESTTLAVIVPEISQYFGGALTQSIEAAARKRGYNVLLCSTGANAKYSTGYVEMLLEQRVAGIIACSIPPQAEVYGKIALSGIPCVLINSIAYGHPLPYVKIDDFQGAYAATQHLVDLGHKQIAMISGNIEDPIAGRPRLEGYRQALRDNGLTVDDLEEEARAFTYANGKLAFERLYARHPEVTGVVTCCDVVAAAVIAAAVHLNLRIPQDLSVVGFDDSEISRVMNPPMTSVVQPFEEMSTAAVEMLLGLISRQKTISSRVYAVQVVPRDSSGKAPTATMSGE